MTNPLRNILSLYPDADRNKKPFEDMYGIIFARMNKEVYKYMLLCIDLKIAEWIKKEQSFDKEALINYADMLVDNLPGNIENAMVAVCLWADGFKKTMPAEMKKKYIKDV